MKNFIGSPVGHESERTGGKKELGQGNENGGEEIGHIVVAWLIETVVIVMGRRCDRLRIWASYSLWNVCIGC